MAKGKLNVDIAERINELEAVLKYFKLKRDIYKILFRGRGLEFDGYRVFTPDDDASEIDWKASARSQQLLVKQYKEERDLKIMFLIDVGSNMVFGSTEKLKCEFATELAAALAYIIIHSNDRVGFFLFSDTISHFIDCRRGPNHFHFFVDVLSEALNYGGKTDINQALSFAMEYFDKSINSVIIISDFLNVTKETETKLENLSSMFETILLRVRDPLDVSLPDVEGEVILEDPATHEQIMINPKVAKQTYAKYALERNEIVEAMFKKSEADYLDLMTNKSFAIPLATFLKERKERGIIP